MTATQTRSQSVTLNAAVDPDLLTKPPSGFWVPYPVTVSPLPDLADAAGVSPFAVTATRPSACGGARCGAAVSRR